MSEDILTTLLNVTLSPSDDEHEDALPYNAQTLAQTRFVVQQVIIPVVVILGLTGNALSIAVLTHRSMRTSTNSYLAALAIFDMLFLLIGLILSFKHIVDIRESTFYAYWYPVGRVLNDICSNVSVSLTVTFTIERYIAVRHPMKGRVICTPKRARIIAALVALFAAISTSPEFFEREYYDKVEGNKTVVASRPSEFGESTGYVTIYFWFLLLMFCIVPLIAICTFNWILIKSVYKANKLRRSMTYVAVQRGGSRQQGEQNRITLMLISVAVVFILCQFPTASLMVFMTYLELAEISLTRTQNNNRLIAGNIANLLVLVNAAINFLLYSVMSTKFRKVFVKVFCKVCTDDPTTFNFSEYSYVSGVSFSRRCSNYKTNSSRITKDDSLSASVGNLIQNQSKERRSWSPAVSREHIRYSSESVCLRNSPTRSCCNGESHSRLMLDTNL